MATTKTLTWVWVILVGLALVAGPLALSGEAGLLRAEAAGCWQAAVTDQWPDLSLAGSVLRVSVQSKVGLKVVVRAKEGSFETSNLTGTKPEYGPYVAEFAPLHRGRYIITPEGLGLSFEVWLDGHNYTRVDFTQKACAPTATPTGAQATATPTRKATVTPTRQAAATATTQPAAGTTEVQWRARIAQQIKNPNMYFATIAVRVIGQPAGQVVEIHTDGYSATAKTGTKPEHGPDACEFAALYPDVYTLTPTGLGISYPVTVGQADFVLVEFYPVGGPVISRWVGSVKQNTSGSTPTEASASAVAVVVTGRPWLEVEIQINDWTATCTTGYKPEYGPAACEFGGLRAGTYTLRPKGLDASAQVTVDGWGWALVQFDPVYVPAPPTTVPTARPTAGRGTARADTATPNVTPTAAAAQWRGWVESNTSGSEPQGIASTIVVRVLGRGGMPVTISGGGGWSATCVTGTKPEYGGDACEFGGLWAATYYLQPEGADVQVSVTMDGAGFAFVHFQGP